MTLNLEEVVDYIYSLSEGEHPFITKDLAETSSDYVKTLFDSVSDLPLPNVAPGPDNMIGVIFEANDHYISIELFGDGHIEMFHEDLVTGLTWFRELPKVEVTDDLIIRLRKVI